MCVKQISVTLENAPGKFLDVSECLGTEGINIRAISVADTSDMSTVRFVTDDPTKTANVLESYGYSIRVTDVIAVEVPDHPGGLRVVLKTLKLAKGGHDTQFLRPGCRRSPLSRRQTITLRNITITQPPPHPADSPFR